MSFGINFGIDFDNLSDDITGYAAVRPQTSNQNNPPATTAGYSYPGLFFSAVRSRLVGANQTDQRRYQAAYGEGASAPTAYYQRAIRWGVHRVVSAATNFLPHPLGQVARLAIGDVNSAPAPQIQNNDFMDQLKQLMNSPISKSVAGLVIPYVESGVEALIAANSTNPLLAILTNVKEALTGVKLTLNRREEEFNAAWGNLAEVIRTLPPLSVHGFGVYSGPNVAEQVQLQPITAAMLEVPPRPATIEGAKADTDFAKETFVQTYSSYSTVLLINLLLHKKTDPYDFRDVLGIMETDYLALSETSPEEAFILAFKATISADPDLGFFKKFLFTSRYVLSFLYWFSNRLIDKTTQTVLTDVRQNVEAFKKPESPTLNPEIAGFGMANRILSKITNMFRYVKEMPSEKLPSGSLEQIMEKISKDPSFWDGKTDAQLKELVANKLVNEYLPRVTLAEDFLAWTNKYPILIPLKMLAIPLYALEYFPNRAVNILARKIINESDILTTLIDGVRTKRGQATSIELTTYRAIRQQLAGVYQGLMDPSDEQEPEVHVDEVHVDGDTVKEIQSLCHLLVKVKHLRDLKDVDAVRAYFGVPSTVENIEKALIDQHGETIGKLVYGIYKALLTDISVEVQFKSVLDALVSSIKTPPISQESLQQQIDSEKAAIETLSSVILRRTVDQAIDSYFEPKDQNSKIIQEVKKIVPLSQFIESIQTIRQSHNPADRKGYAQQLDTQIVAARQHLIVLREKLQQERPNPTDLQAELNYINKLIAQLDACQIMSSYLKDACILQRMATKPEYLIASIERMISEISPRENTDALKRRLKDIERLFRTQRETIGELSNGPKLIQEFQATIRVYDDWINGRFQQGSLADLKAKCQTHLESLKDQTSRHSFMDEAFVVGQIEELGERFIQGSELDRLLKEQLVLEQLDIHLISKDSAVAKFAKNQAAAILDQYMKGVIPLLRDPLIFSVGIETLLDEFVQ